MKHKSVDVTRFPASDYNAATSTYAPAMVPVAPHPSLPDTFVELGTKVFCKNYLGEEMVRRGTNLNAGTYQALGNKAVDGLKEIPLEEGYWVLYRFTGPIVRDTVINNFKLINKFERYVGIPPEDKSVLYIVNGSITDVVIYCGPRWVYSPLLYSIHITFIRCITYNTGSVGLLTHLNALAEKGKERVLGFTFFRDLDYLDASKYAGIDLKEVVKDYDKFIDPSSRFTGLDDNLYNIIPKQNVDDYNYSSTPNKYKLVLKKDRLNDTTILESSINSTFRLDHIHDNSGIYSFSNGVMVLKDYTLEQLESLEFLRTSDNRDFFNYFGSLWAYNYCIMKAKKGGE